MPSPTLPGPRIALATLLAGTLAAVLASFWENHDPTKGDRQGNDIGSNYRSAIYTHGDVQFATATATATKAAFQNALAAEGYGAITTEIAPLTRYITAEDYHQDYLEFVPEEAEVTRT